MKLFWWGILTRKLSKLKTGLICHQIQIIMIKNLELKTNSELQLLSWSPRVSLLNTVSSLLCLSSSSDSGVMSKFDFCFDTHLSEYLSSINDDADMFLRNISYWINICCIIKHLSYIKFPKSTVKYCDLKLKQLFTFQEHHMVILSIWNDSTFFSDDASISAWV